MHNKNLNYKFITNNAWHFQKYMVILNKTRKYNMQNLMRVEENRQEDVTINETSEMYAKIFEWTVYN